MPKYLNTSHRHVAGCAPGEEIPDHLLLSSDLGALIEGGHIGLVPPTPKHPKSQTQEETTP